MVWVAPLEPQERGARPCASETDMSDDRLVVLQAVRRVRNALKSAQEWSVKRGSPKER